MTFQILHMKLPPEKSQNKAAAWNHKTYVDLLIWEPFPPTLSGGKTISSRVTSTPSPSSNASVPRVAWSDCRREAVVLLSGYASLPILILLLRTTIIEFEYTLARTSDGAVKYDGWLGRTASTRLMMATAAAKAMNLSSHNITRRVRVRTCDCPSLDNESDNPSKENLCRLHSRSTAPWELRIRCS